MSSQALSQVLTMLLCSQPCVWSCGGHRLDPGGFFPPWVDGRKEPNHFLAVVPHASVELCENSANAYRSTVCFDVTVGCLGIAMGCLPFPKTPLCLDYQPLCPTASMGKWPPDHQPLHPYPAVQQLHGGPWTRMSGRSHARMVATHPVPIPVVLSLSPSIICSPGTANTLLWLILPQHHTDMAVSSSLHKPPLRT